jgi:hypothetical protein
VSVSICGEEEQQQREVIEKFIKKAKKFLLNIIQWCAVFLFLVLDVQNDKRCTRTDRGQICIDLHWEELQTLEEFQQQPQQQQFEH